MPSEATYAIVATAYLLPWLVVFWRRPDLRRELGMASVFSVLGSLPFEYFFWSRDWWHPTTISGTRVGIEDVLYGIGQGGLFATLFCFAVGRRLTRARVAPKLTSRLLPFALLMTVPLALILGVGMRSAVATIVGELLALAAVLVVRRDLLPLALGSAALGLLLSAVFDVAVELLQPGFITATWYVDQLWGIWVLGLPLEDVLWKALAGALVGTIFKCWNSLSVADERAKVVARAVV
jgi:hypothetical protein